jgi:hypothetical protein
MYWIPLPISIRRSHNKQVMRLEDVCAQTCIMQNNTGENCLKSGCQSTKKSLIKWLMKIINKPSHNLQSSGQLITFHTCYRLHDGFRTCTSMWCWLIWFIHRNQSNVPINSMIDEHLILCQFERYCPCDVLYVSSML